MRIKLNNRRAVISMEGFIHDLLQEYRPTQRRASPAAARLFELKAAEELDEEDKKKFHATIAKLLYLAKWMRPDILLVVSFRCTRVRYRRERIRRNWTEEI